MEVITHMLVNLSPTMWKLHRDKCHWNLSLDYKEGAEALLNPYRQLLCYRIQVWKRKMFASLIIEL
jgi:hypothetical protein